jgi:O-antigen/teichoic acid export membrane protein
VPKLLSQRLRGLVGRLLDGDARELLHQGGVALGLKLLAAAASFAFTLILARRLGADGTGLYYLALSVVTFAAVCSRLGLDNALLRLSAAHADRQQWRQLRAVARSGLGLAAAAGLLLTLLTLAFAPLVAERLFSKPELAAPLRWMALAILPVNLSLLYGELLKGLKRIFAATLVQAVLLPAGSLLAIALLARRWGVRGAVWSYLLAALAAAAVAIVLWHRVTPPRDTPTRGTAPNARQDGEPIVRRLLAASLPLLVIALVQVTMQTTTTLVLGVWRNSAEVGIFGVASRTAQLSGLFLVAINSIAAPKLAAQHSRGDLPALARTARTAAVLASLAASPLLAFFLFAPGLTLRLFGVQFAGGEGALILLTLGQLVNVCAGSVGTVLMMSGHEKALMRRVVAASLLQLVASLWLVPRWGLLGAAAANAGGMVMLNLSALQAVRSLLGISLLPGLPARRGGAE